MLNLVDCPACEGRGSYCLRVDDGTYSDILLVDVPCELCNGKRQVPFADAMEYNLWEDVPAFPYAEAD